MRTHITRLRSTTARVGRVASIAAMAHCARTAARGATHHATGEKEEIRATNRRSFGEHQNSTKQQEKKKQPGRLASTAPRRPAGARQPCGRRPARAPPTRAACVAVLRAGPQQRHRIDHPDVDDAQHLSQRYDCVPGRRRGRGGSARPGRARGQRPSSGSTKMAWPRCSR